MDINKKAHSKQTKMFLTLFSVVLELVTSQSPSFSSPLPNAIYFVGQEVDVSIDFGSYLRNLVSMNPLKFRMLL